MKKSVYWLILCVTVFVLVPQALIAKTGYVSDMLLLTFREGPGLSFPVIKTLRSSTPVKILKEENGFFKVELGTQEIGWVDQKFIIFDLPNALIVKQQESAIQSFENKVTELKNRLQDLKQQLSSSNDDNIKRIQTLETELSHSKDTVKDLSVSLSQTRNTYNTLVQKSKNIQHILNENKTLTEQNQSLTKEVSTLKKKGKALLKTGMIKWFLAGVGTLLLGWILGQSISSRKRSGSSLLN